MPSKRVNLIEVSAVFQVMSRSMISGIWAPYLFLYLTFKNCMRFQGGVGLGQTIEKLISRINRNRGRSKINDGYLKASETI